VPQHHEIRLRCSIRFIICVSANHHSYLVGNERYCLMQLLLYSFYWHLCKYGLAAPVSSRHNDYSDPPRELKSLSLRQPKTGYWFGMKLSWWCKKSDYWCCFDNHINLIVYLEEERLSGIDSRQQRVGHPNILLFYFYNHTIKEDTEK